MLARETPWRTTAICTFLALIVAASVSFHPGVDASTAAAFRGRKLHDNKDGVPAKHGPPGPAAKEWKTCPAKGGSPGTYSIFKPTLESSFLIRYLWGLSNVVWMRVASENRHLST